MTVQQIRSRSKEVTRRLGYSDLEPGEIFCAVEKMQGLKKGEKVKPLAVLMCECNWPERLDRITKKEVDLEGFPEMSPAEFVKMFCKANGCKPWTVVNRIQFHYL